MFIEKWRQAGSECTENINIEFQIWRIGTLPTMFDADFRHDENEFRLTFSMFIVLLGQQVHRDVDTAVARAAANS